MSKDSPGGLAQLFNDLHTAAVGLMEAEKEERVAASNTTYRRNEVNSIQKAIDAEMKKLRESAPRGTDWADRKRMSVPE